MTASPTDPRDPRDPLVDEKAGAPRMFDRIAHRYDLLNRVLSGGLDVRWRKRALLELPREPRPGGLSVLDLATGTGDVALLLLDDPRVGHVVAADLSEGMLAHARRKLSEHPRAADSEVRVADACALPFADGSFDALTMCFGLRNVVDLDGCLRELARVLRRGGTEPGGRAIVLEFATPEPGAFRWAYEAYRKHLLPRVGALVSGDAHAYGYLDRTIEAFPSGNALVERFRAAGFTSARFVPLMFGSVGLYVADVGG